MLSSHTARLRLYHPPLKHAPCHLARMELLPAVHMTKTRLQKPHQSIKHLLKVAPFGPQADAIVKSNEFIIRVKVGRRAAEELCSFELVIGGFICSSLLRGKSQDTYHRK